MIAILLGLASALWGGFLARRRKGSRLDIAQYAAAFGIAGFLVGLILTVVASRVL
ncbi:PEP-CTERM protein-sorting domain-containing protein [Tranquillimonas rosea]|uniref:PEP-CTERM protein-sorting domain-containing protein n=1 Tax=Tranquillimonas rosea TaxID=641238 RepID=A0A1H9TMN6_9RHOB|nr:hypothetical protein [Tranquillimonas rosea]SER98317.1 PEP-CTERM protein-sorting domain-containing protein [Tranquillimonas rosea]